MELTFVDVDLNPKKPKATIHLSGKLGFNNDSIAFMKLSDLKFLRVAHDKDINTLYLLPTKDEKGAAKVAKAGSYFYLNAGETFKNLGFDYENSIISFDITAEPYNGQTIYKLSKNKETERKDENGE